MKLKKITALFLLSSLLFSIFSCFPVSGENDSEEQGENEEDKRDLVYTETADGYSVALSPDSTAERIEIPESYKGNPVTEIRENGFNSLFVGAKIEEIKIPSTVKRVGEGAFDGMSSIKRVEITDIESYLKIDFASIFSNPTVFAGSLYLGEEILTDLTVPDTITEIKDYAFASCRSLKSITLHDGVEKIGVSAFEGCSSLERVIIGKDVTEVGGAAFYGCESISDFTNRSDFDFTEIIKGVIDTVKINNKNTKMVGHAGLAGVVLQNTKESFLYAAERSYYGIETDVRKTKDGKYVCFHDPSLLASAGVDASIESLTLSEIKEITLYDKKGVESKEKGYKIISLSEYIEICKQYGKRAYVELKTPIPKEDVGEIIDIITECGYIENSTFISFYYDNLLSVRSFLPEQKVGFTFKTAGDNVEAQFDKIVKDGFDVNMSINVVTKEWVDRFHAAGLEVTCYTIDDPTVAESLVEMGVNYILTNKLE